MTARSDHSHPLISLIITTKNEEKNIRICLESIAAQSYSNIETIVVDNQSADQTKEIALQYTKKVFDKGPERSSQRNFGMIEKSEGKYVMFIDADMILSPYLIEACVQKSEKETASALYIPEIVLGKKFFSQVRRFERMFYNGTPIDGARFFLKSAFVKTGGFDLNMSGPEDWDMDKKIKKSGDIHLLQSNIDGNIPPEIALFVRERGVKPDKYGEVIFHNESEFKVGQYLKKKKYYSKSFDTYAEKWGENDPDIKKQLGLFYRFFGVFIEKGKWKRLIAHPLLTFGMYFLRFMVGIQYLSRKQTAENPYEK